MKNKIVGVTAIAATLIILAYAVIAANQNAVDNSQACNHASDNGKAQASENSVLSSCGTPPPSSCGNGNCEPELGEDPFSCSQDCSG